MPEQLKGSTLIDLVFTPTDSGKLTDFGVESMRSLATFYR